MTRRFVQAWRHAVRNFDHLHAPAQRLGKLGGGGSRSHRRMRQRAGQQRLRRRGDAALADDLRDVRAGLHGGDLLARLRQEL